MRLTQPCTSRTRASHIGHARHDGDTYGGDQRASAAGLRYVVSTDERKKVQLT